MRKLFIISALIGILIATYVGLNYKSSVEENARDFLENHQKHLEHIFKLTEEKGYVSVQWLDEDRVSTTSPIKLAWKQNYPKNLRIDNPDLENVISYSRDQGITRLWIRKVEGNWIVLKAFQWEKGDKFGEGLYLFGTPNNKELCSQFLSQSECVIEVSENWYMIKI